MGVAMKVAYAINVFFGLGFVRNLIQARNLSVAFPRGLGAIRLSSPHRALGCRRRRGSSRAACTLESKETAEKSIA